MTPLTRRQVTEAFDRDAPAYDRLVGANPGYHAHLRRSARAFGFGNRPVRLLDVGCGTGASTAALLAAAPNAYVVGVDASTGMLAQARAKPWPDRVEFVHARAEELADAGVTGPFDGVFAAYLVRNLPDLDAVLASLWSVLRPGGRLIIHDYSIHDHPLTRLIWHIVCWGIIIPAGRLTTGDARLYRYLWRSALEFDRPQELAERLRRAGFTDVRAGTMTGWQRGIVYAFGGRRPGTTPYDPGAAP